MGLLLNMSCYMRTRLYKADFNPTQSQQYHLSNPYWKTFDPYVIPLLDQPMDLRRFEEMDTSTPTTAAAAQHYHEDALKQETSVGTMYKDAA